MGQGQGREFVTKNRNLNPGDLHRQYTREMMSKDPEKIATGICFTQQQFSDASRNKRRAERNNLGSDNWSRIESVVTENLQGSGPRPGSIQCVELNNKLIVFYNDLSLHLYDLFVLRKQQPLISDGTDLNIIPDPSSKGKPWILNTVLVPNLKRTYPNPPFYLFCYLTCKHTIETYKRAVSCFLHALESRKLQKSLRPLYSVSDMGPNQA